MTVLRAETIFSASTARASPCGLALHVMPGQIGTSIRANTQIHSGDREADAIDAAGLTQARERFALLCRDVSQLSDDQLRKVVAELRY